MTITLPDTDQTNINSCIFIEKSHTYLINGKRVDSVTGIVKSFEMMPGARFATDEHMWRGSQIHTALEFYNKGTLARGSLDPQIEPYLRGFERFVAETGWRTLGFEKPLFDPLLGFGGRPDIWGEMWFREMGPPPIWIGDYKTGAAGAGTRLQLAGYQSLLAANKLIPAGRVVKRFALELKPTGDYNVKIFDDDNDLYIWQMLLSIHNWRKQHVR